MMKSSIQRTEDYVQSFFSGDASGHDWYHTHRVRNNAVQIAKKEGADGTLCEYAALLHDVADDKFHEHEGEGRQTVETYLREEGIDRETGSQIMEIIETVSFKGGNNRPPGSLEAEVVQDADRLEALGAVGVARCFMYAGNKGDAMYLPEEKADVNRTGKDYRNHRSSAINHFYEKLLLLKDDMKTISGKEMAEDRHRFLEVYLQQFFDEWEGSK